MKKIINYYINNLYHNVPEDVYEGLLSLFCIGAILLIAINGTRKGWKQVAGLFLIEYVFLIFCSTVIFRQYVETVGHNFNLFWSYEAIQNGRNDLLVVIIMNVLVFVPVGLLLSIVTPQMKMENGGWKSGVALALCIGVFISLSIEALQYFLKRGYAEFDDVFHNTLGCLIGYGLIMLVKQILKNNKT